MNTENAMAVKPETNLSISGNNIYYTVQGFEQVQRVARVFASSTIVPKDYQGNLGNCIIAIEMASRLNVSPVMVMQNLYIVNGRPAWSSQYIIAMINSSRKYKTEIQFDLKGAGDTLECTAYAEDYAGHTVTGPRITMKMAREEGWTTKNGSKWKTMPEVMIRYRAASFFGRLNCPDMIMGIYSTDEVVELGENDYNVMSAVTEQANEEIAAQANRTTIPEEPKTPATDPTTGEVLPDEDAELDGPDF